MKKTDWKVTPVVKKTTIRLDEETWKYANKIAYEQDISFNEVILRAVRKLKKSQENVLTE
jgi:predicted HicB family RNase H-like nuclease